MKQQRSQEMNKLQETLKELGISIAALSEMQVVLESPADAKKNEQLYRAVNEEYLLPFVEKRDLGECIHITGEMRALADRSHRLVCREEREKYHKPIKMVCSLPPISNTKDRTDLFYSTVGAEILKWIQLDWKDPNLKWSDYLDIFDLMGDGYVSLFSLPRPERIHYSVFADEYVLLQAHHPTGVHVKDVWFIKSRVLFEVLREQANAVIRRAENLSFSIFKRLTLSVSNSTALQILFLLSKTKGLRREELFRQVKEFSSHQNVYGNLKSIGFLREDGDCSEVTEQGFEYLKLFS